MSLIDGPHAPVCVVVGAGAGAERSHCKQKKKGNKSEAKAANNLSNLCV